MSLHQLESISITYKMTDVINRETFESSVFPVKNTFIYTAKRVYTKWLVPAKYFKWLLVARKSNSYDSETRAANFLINPEFAGKTLCWSSRSYLQIAAQIFLCNRWLRRSDLPRMMWYQHHLTNMQSSGLCNHPLGAGFISASVCCMREFKPTRPASFDHSHKPYP